MILWIRNNNCSEYFTEKEDFDCQQSNGHAKTTTKPMRRTVSGTAYRSCRTDKQTVCCSSTKAEETSIISKDYVTTKIDVQSLSIQVSLSIPLKLLCVLMCI